MNGENSLFCCILLRSYIRKYHVSSIFLRLRVTRDHLLPWHANKLLASVFKLSSRFSMWECYRLSYYGSLTGDSTVGLCQWTMNYQSFVQVKFFVIHLVLHGARSLVIVVQHAGVAACSEQWYSSIRIAKVLKHLPRDLRSHLPPVTSEMVCLISCLLVTEYLLETCT